jgi:hypothetical protein
MIPTAVATANSIPKTKTGIDKILAERSTNLFTSLSGFIKIKVSDEIRASMTAIKSGGIKRTKAKPKSVLGGWGALKSLMIITPKEVEKNNTVIQDILR